MLSEWRKESVKLLAGTLNAFAIVVLISGLIAPFITEAPKATLLEIASRIAVGIVIHICAQTVLFFGLKQEKDHKNGSNQPNISNGDDCAGDSDVAIGGELGVRPAGKALEGARPEDLKR